MSESNLWSYGLPGTNSENFETRSLPTLARYFPRSFTFYVADPVISIREQVNTNGLPVAAVNILRVRTTLHRRFLVERVVLNALAEKAGR